MDQFRREVGELALAPFPGFRSLVTHHCVTGSMRHIYEYHGYPISEELLLGLGAGVGYVYWHMKGQAPIIGGRANVGRPGEEGLERTAGRRTGVRVEVFTTGSARKAEAALLAMLAGGEPAMLTVDMGYLPYFDFPEEFHFGGHVVVACGYDAAGGTVLVADRDEELHAVALADLARARGSRYKPFPPQHAWCTFGFSARRPPTADEVRQAIREVATGMLLPPIANLGVKGIRKTATAVQEWPALMDEGELRRACLNAFIFIDATGGTGGGLFRYMYGRFLGEAARIADDERLAEVGQEMARIGDLWQQVALAFRQAETAPDPATVLPAAARPLPEIADREEAAWERLRSLVT